MIESFLEHMDKQGIVPNLHTYNALLSIFPKDSRSHQLFRPMLLFFSSFQSIDIIDSLQQSLCESYSSVSIRLSLWLVM